jgi:hypothetical protein
VSHSKPLVIGATIFVALGALAHEARAGITSRLVYSRAATAASCPDEASLRAAVAERLGYDPFVAYATTTVVAEVFRDGSKLEARAHLVDPSGTTRGSRELSVEGDDCRPLVTALALAISIALDPMTAVAAPPNKARSPDARPPAQESLDRNPGDDRPAPPAVDPGSPPVAPDRVAAAPDASRGIRPRAGAGTFVAIGSLPATAAGFAAAIGASLDRWSIDLRGFGILPTSLTPSSGLGRIDAWSWGASMVPCAHVSVAAFCGLATAGEIVASGEGVTSPERKSAFYTALGVRAGLEWAASQALTLELWGDLAAPLSRTRLGLNGSDVWVTPRVAAAAGTGIALRL